MLLNNKCDIPFSFDVIKENSKRLTNQFWKLIPMRENEEDWEKQLETVLIEIIGLKEIFYNSTIYLQILSKLEGLKNKETSFEIYRKTVFECINLIQELC